MENKAHANDAWAQRFAPQTWREPSHGRSYRTCSYCGCIHPEDLIAYVKGGGTLGGSDWKYGWPHKFYLHGGEFGKWYNVHLVDLDEAQFAELAALIEQHAGIKFEKDAQGIKYTAPYAGYQKVNGLPDLPF